MSLRRSPLFLRFPWPLLITLGGCASGPESEGRLAQDAARWMSGTFSSSIQAERDPENYFSIRMVILPTWVDRDDGPWLYVEQAANDALERPYRQRVYHLVQTGADTVRSDIYTLPGEPLDWSGCWRDGEPLRGLRPEDLTLRAGCSIELRRTAADRWEGSTQGTGCESSLGSASYATSIVTLTADQLTSWDRGFDDEGQQVWGAENGAYEFDKLLPSAPQ